MFKYWSINRYGSKLLPSLEKQYGIKKYYSASEVRTTVFKNNFSPKYLPLGYLLFLDHQTLMEAMYIEFPQVNVDEYRQSILHYLESKSYQGCLQRLHQGI
jgi:hypothetical protein